MVGPMKSRRKLARESRGRARSGNVMIEFALLAPVFFMLIMGLVEFVVFQYKTYALNHVVYEATRNLQTGEVQVDEDGNPRTPAEMRQYFMDQACEAAGAMVDCNSMYFDVRAFDALQDVTYPPPEFDEDGIPTNFVFQPGKADQYSVVRASLHHQFITPFMDKIFHMGPDLPAIVNAYVIVRNEPWI